MEPASLAIGPLLHIPPTLPCAVRDTAVRASVRAWAVSATAQWGLRRAACVRARLPVGCERYSLSCAMAAQNSSPCRRTPDTRVLVADDGRALAARSSCDDGRSIRTVLRPGPVEL